MAQKTFSLVLKNDVRVKTIEELRENFDLEKAVEYFKSGELLEWLEDRFYDDEAEKIENISADDRNLSQKICAALNVECDEDSEFTQRVREKKKILAEKTDDENIIDNAMTTALNQDDLANLLHMDYSTIFLCGENFTVPIRVENKKYIGVLSTPKIKIRANSDEELEAKNISFENCKLPWTKESPIEELKALANKIFGNNGDWTRQFNKSEKSMILKMLGGYTESQIVYLKVEDDFSAGFALTIDSFCTAGKLGNFVIKYNNIESVDDCNDLTISTKFGSNYYANDYEDIDLIYDNYEEIIKFLNIVKNF